MDFRPWGYPVRNLWVTLGLGILLSLSVQAQDNIALLKKQLTVAKTDTARSRILYALGVYYEEVDHDSSRYFLTQSLQITQRSHDPRATATVMQRLGYLYTYYLNDNAKALEWLNKGIAVAKKNHDTLNLTRCYEYMAVVAYYQRARNAEEIAQQAIDYAQKAADWRVLTDAYGIMAMIQGDQHNDKQVEIYSLLAMKACEKYNFDKWFSEGLGYAALLKQHGKPEQARLVYRQLNVVKHKFTMSSGYHNYLHALADLAIGLGNYARAQQLLEKSVAVEKAKAKPDTFRLVHVEIALLRVYAQQGNYQQAYVLGKELASMQMWLQEKRITRSTEVKLTQLKANLDLEKKEHEITVLAEQRNRQQIYLIGAVLVAALLLGFAFVVQRAKQRIERQKTELGHLNTTKDKLFAILAHDLRSPVASLKTYLMLINWGALNKQELIESAAGLSMQLNSVHTMLENTLNWSLSQMDGIHPRFETLSVSAIIEQQIEVLRPVAESKGIQLLNQIPPQANLVADKNHLAVIFRNLLQNALKFTPTGGRIEFTSEEQNGFLTIAVRDTGIGMDKTMLSSLFKLNKSSSRLGTANEVGTGLGLVLVDELVKVNRGTIEVTSELGKGTSFRLAFALEAATLKATEVYA